MDLAITSYLLMLCAAIVFRIGRRFGADHPKVGQILLLFGIAVTVWLAWSAGSSFRWALLIPHSFVLLISNAFVILVVGSAGLLVGTQCLSPACRQSLSERAAVIALCMTAAWFMGSAVFRPLWQPIALCGPSQWSNGVCLQSHESSCAPAAAATLLRKYGINTTESDMANACLTSSRGTLALGTFRGLCIATSESQIRPHAILVDPASIPAAVIERDLPMLVHVDFNLLFRSARLRSVTDREGHAVVILARENDGTWMIADPAVGQLRWTDERLRRLWVGEAIAMRAANPKR